jgi:ACT domain-containing protein
MDKYDDPYRKQKHILDQDQCIKEIKNNISVGVIMDCNDNYCEIYKYKEVLEALKTNTSVRAINITFNYTKLYDEWCFVLCDLLKITTTISTLVLQIYNITDTGLKLLYEGLTMNTSINDVSISYNTNYSSITIDDNFILLANMLKYNSYIINILLYFYNFNSTSWINITDSLKVNKTLETFKLRLNKSNFDGSIQLNKLLQVNKTINHIDLQTSGMIKYKDIICGLKQNAHVTYFHETTSFSTIYEKHKLNKYRDRNMHNNKCKTIRLQDL